MGVTSEKITPYAKILSVVDVYDALVTERPYKKSFSQRTAVDTNKNYEVILARAQAKSVPFFIE